MSAAVCYFSTTNLQQSWDWATTFGKQIIRLIVCNFVEVTETSEGSMREDLSLVLCN